MKLPLLIIILISFSFAFWLPMGEESNLTRQTYFTSTSFDMFPKTIYHTDIIIYSQNRYTAFSSCNSSISLIEVDKEWAYINSSQCGKKWIKNDNRWWYMCNGVYLQYHYTFKNRSVFDLGYLYNTNWIHQGRYNCER